MTGPRISSTSLETLKRILGMATKPDATRTPDPKASFDDLMRQLTGGGTVSNRYEGPPLAIPISQSAMPEYIGGPGGAPKIVGKVGERLKQVLGVRPTSIKLKDTESWRSYVYDRERWPIKDMGMFFRPPVTREFDEWLGRSKLISQVGDPKPLFHGTDRSLDVLEPKGRRLIFAADNTPTAENYAAEAVLRNQPTVKPGSKVRFRSNPQVYPLYGRMEQPLDLSFIPSTPQAVDDPALYEALGQFGLNKLRREKMMMTAGNESVWRILEKLGIDRDVLRRRGFDGTIFNDVDYSGRPHRSYAFTDPNQLKSAIGNSGAFSRNSNNIALGLAGLTTAASTRNRDKP